jgi:hypothetical protein
MSEQAFNYRDYAPLVPPKLRPPVVRQRPQLVRSQPGPIIPPSPGEIADQLGRIRNSLVLIRQSFTEIGAILWRRFLGWCDTHILRNLTVAWSLNGVGWAALVSISVLQYFVR